MCGLDMRILTVVVNLIYEIMNPIEEPLIYLDHYIMK